MVNMMRTRLRSIFDEGELESNEETGAWEESPSTSSIVQDKLIKGKGKETEEPPTPPEVPFTATAVAASAPVPGRVLLTPAETRQLNNFRDRLFNIASRTTLENRINEGLDPGTDGTAKIGNLRLYNIDMIALYDLRDGGFTRLPGDEKELKELFHRIFHLLARPLFFATFGIDYEKLYDAGGMNKDLWLFGITEDEMKKMARELRGRFILRFTVRALQLRQKWQELGVYPPIPETLDQLEETMYDEDGFEVRRQHFTGLFTPQTAESDAWLHQFYDGFSELLNIEKMLHEDGPEVREWMVFCVSKISELTYEIYTLREVFENLLEQDAVMSESGEEA